MKFLFHLLLVLVATTVSGQQPDYAGTTIFWDNSRSAENRDLEKDLNVLQRIFDQQPEQEVQLVFFNIKAEEQTFHVQGGDWSALKLVLQKATYDGATYFKQLEGMARFEKVYLFTDGSRSFEDDRIPLKKGDFLINSNPDRDEAFLKRSALLTRSRLMDFPAVMPENIGQLNKPRQKVHKALKGVVYIDNEAASNVRVAIKGADEFAITDDNGRFALNALPTDSLIITSRASRTYKTVRVTSASEMDIFLEAERFTLEEVVLMEKAPEPAELVNTGYGLENKEKLGYATQRIDDEDISAIQTDVSQSVVNRFSNVSLGQKDDISKATMRTNTSILFNNYSLVVIDGVPQQQSDSSRDATNSQANFNFIDPANIASIQVLKGLAATNRYGSLGSNGVILITTKTAQAGNGQSKIVDQARLKNNIYKDEEDNSRPSVSPLVQSLEAASTMEEAYDTYLSFRIFNAQNKEFYLDAFSFFKDKDPKKAAVIISNLLELLEEEENEIRTVAMAFHAAGAYEEALLAYESLIKKNPDEVQAYFNRAITYRDMGRYQEAYNEISGLLKGQKYPQLDTQGLSKTLNREIRNLIYHHGSKINIIDAEQAWSNNLRFAVRAVFEWDIPGVQFELQFVNPENRYFNWSHTNAANSSRIREELGSGSRMEEFEFYGDLKGQWILNAQKTEDGDNKKNVFSLKCTLYKNFGEARETKEEIWLHFKKQGEKKLVKKVVI